MMKANIIREKKKNILSEQTNTQTKEKDEMWLKTSEADIIGEIKRYPWKKNGVIKTRIGTTRKKF